MLDCRPLTGYDIKKIMQDSSYMHWSGNNNQIYKALVELLEDNLVTGEVEYQDKSPAKKVYTITEKGRKKLKEWSRSEPEPAELKKAFLIQLAWADILDEDELYKLLKDYETEVSLQLIMNREKIRRGGAFKPRSEREELLWKLIDENILSSYQIELDWIRKAIRKLYEFKPKEDSANMDYKIADNGNIRYLELISTVKPLDTEQDMLDLISLCGENEINMLLIHGSCLSEDFYNLKTGVAGAMLQKLVNYYIKAAVVITDKSGLSKRFTELISEANQGSQYCFPSSVGEAEDWFERKG
jgi:DNA-binding PadR family transcriptional regulator